jgi:hypothetical protein
MKEKKEKIKSDITTDYQNKNALQYYENLYANKPDKIEKMEKSLDIYNLPRPKEKI